MEGGRGCGATELRYRTFGLRTFAFEFSLLYSDLMQTKIVFKGLRYIE